MLVDSFDKKNYVSTLHFKTNTDEEQKDFKSLLQSQSKKLISDVNNAYSSNFSNDTRLDRGDKQYQNLNGSSQKIHLGKLSDDTPTVSELLYNTQYKDKCWEMLESDVNSSKHFKKIPAGTDIYLDKKTSEIVWGQNYEKKSGVITNDDITQTRVLSILPRSSKTISQPGSDISLGAKQTYYSKKKVSVADHLKISSDLLNSRGADSSTGSDSDIPEPSLSSTIYSNRASTIDNAISDTGIHKSEDLPYKYKSSLHKYTDKSDEPALDDAVKEFMGKNYNKMDCYELVVSGLENMGIKYTGKGGLGRHLINKAIDKGLSRNHYLTGEGLLEATGHSVYNKTAFSVKKPVSQAESVMKEMQKVLKEGQILSFSTRTRGHTGIVSKQDGIWTFINSGYMDNNISGKNGTKQVGEEILAKELENWFRVANSRKEGLKITLGDIDASKLVAYKTYKPKLSKKV